MFGMIALPQEIIVPWRIGDIVTCKYREHAVVPKSDPEFDGKINLKIIGYKMGGFGASEFVALVTEDDTAINGQMRVGSFLIKDYDIDPKYSGNQAIYIKPNNIVKVHFRADGLACSRCTDFYYMAEPNQPDGSLICYLCRENPYR